jgi:hypothetical protein
MTIEICHVGENNNGAAEPACKLYSRVGKRIVGSTTKNLATSIFGNKAYEKLATPWEREVFIKVDIHRTLHRSIFL